ncbi:MAG: PKD domain-containing protein [Candidatus Kapabacteria bacterium]|nr:PKD domain-containing protein [Candidatus Kapabacteria bacterium]
MKTLISILILSIALTMNLHSQWLEKEGYWELSEKIPDLRDLKIIPEENLVITVSKDNTIRHIEYDSGKILKSGKPAELTEDNDYAKISGDGKTTVVARYKNNLYLDTVKVSIINNFEFSLMGDTKLVNTYNLKYNFHRITRDVFITYSDFEFINNYLIFGFYINFEGIYGESITQFNTGSFSFVDFSNVNHEIIKSYVQYIPYSILKFSNSQKYKYSIIGNYREYNGYYTKGGKVIRRNILQLVNNNLDTVNLFSSLFTEESYPNTPTKKSGYIFPMEQVLESNTDSLLYIRGDGKLYTFNINQKKFTDSVASNFLKSNIWFMKETKYIGHLSNNNYSIYGSLNLQKLDGFTLPSDFLYPYPFIDETNNKTLFALKDGSIIYKSFDILNDIPQTGFYWSKDTIYEGESINFRAITNIDSCKYEWQFINNNFIQSESADTSFKYLKPGIYRVTLVITKQDGSKLSFIKDSIITVLEIVKADFEITKLNDKLPLKIQFTDKSTGYNKSWNWDFGDGKSSTEQNPIHEYKFAGDFSPSLIVSDGIDKDTIKKFEYVINNIPTPLLENSDTKIQFKENLAQFNGAFKALNGLNLNWTRDYFVPNGYQNYGDYYCGIISSIYDFKFLQLDNYANSHMVYKYFQKIKKPQLLNLEKIVYSFYDAQTAGTHSFNFSNHEYIKNNDTKLSMSSVILSNRNGSIFWVCNVPNNPLLIKTDYDFNILSELSIPPNAKQYIADTIDNGLNLIIKELNNSYSYFSISPENTITTEKSFSLDTNITLTNIKSVNENLIILYGSYIDSLNKTSYAYFAKYHPLDNTLQDTILYSRKDISKLERVNNSTYAAIGQSRGRQGYLLLDTNLHQIKDIRVDSLTGEIKDMILHDNKVYLFTEKIVSLETMALGANESYQTTASVLSLPDDIIADVNENPVFTGKSFTHSAYPNPANDEIQIKINANTSGNCNIKLYDLLGTEVMNIFEGMLESGTEKVFNISLSNLQTGTYYYTISSPQGFSSEKIVIIR